MYGVRILCVLFPGDSERRIKETIERERERDRQIDREESVRKWDKDDAHVTRVVRRVSEKEKEYNINTNVSYWTLSLARFTYIQNCIYIDT